MTDLGGEPSPGPDWCYSCNRSEPIPPNAFWVCGECHHCWSTVDDFTADVRKMLDDIGGLPANYTTPLRVWPYCPLCAHDF